MTPNDFLAGTRAILNDSAGTRCPDSEFLGYVNDCLNVMVDLRPDLFIASGTHTCTVGAEQTAVFPRQRKVVSVERVVGGAAVLPADRRSLDAFKPTWYLDAEAAAANWLPHESPTRFYLYPPAPAGQQVLVDFVQAHARLTALTDAISLPESYAPAIQAYCINRAESKDDEKINSGRAAAFMSDFAGMIGANKPAAGA